MMHRQMQQEDPKTEILEAMRMTDKHKKGYILASELRAKLTGLGEKLTEKEGINHLGSFWLGLCRFIQRSELIKTSFFFFFYVRVWIDLKLHYNMKHF